MRPKSIAIYLMGNDQYILTATLSDDNEWLAIYEVPKYTEDGEEIQYAWKEKGIPGYHIESTYDINEVTTIVNRVYQIIPPEGVKPPKLPGKPVSLIELDDYMTALGLEVSINHCGDCFD